MLNPTSCEPFNFSATVIGGGADPTNPADNDPVTATTPFRVTACGSLKFEPKFQVTTSGKTSKADGASLHVDLTYPSGSLGHDANIKQVKVDLPKQLPSRLTTLQKACTAAQFAANPAGCPAASLIGHASAVTPILPVPLDGPAYFVSHGGEAFPDLEIVLQGVWRHDRPDGQHVHQQRRDHEQHVQNGPRPARHVVRTDAPRGPLLRPRGERKPLRGDEDGDRGDEG